MFRLIRGQDYVEILYINDNSKIGYPLINSKTIGFLQGLNINNRGELKARGVYR